MATDNAVITVYWRPGCIFCRSLLRRLKRTGVPHRTVNIWDDPSAAAVVRSIASGNETVPTVTVGPVSLVNPSLDVVLQAAQVHVPDAVPESWEPRQPGRIARWMASRLGGSSKGR